MSDTTAITPHGASDDSGHDGHAHNKNLAHHFETPQQQFDAGKLGIWLFLTTEVLLFSGMFCAYSVYRANHPEIFEYAHHWLNKTLGAVNTVVLIFSSFTMAWAVRAAQLGQRKLLIALLSITLACGGVFMCIKGVEYSAKFEHKTLWGDHYNPAEPPAETPKEAAQDEKMAQTEKVPTPPQVGPMTTAGATTAAAAPAVDPASQAPQVGADGFQVLHSAIQKAAIGPAGVSGKQVEAEKLGPEPANVQIFFGIYFIMTGLHGLHVLGGMAVIAWLLIRAIRGDFGPDYFNPVDFTGLYWHLVDLIWIFLFPLLYLIQ